MRNNTPLFVLHNVSVSLQGQAVLHNINWQVHSGEQWAVVGPSGAGKSVLLRLLASRLHYTGGVLEYPYLDQLYARHQLHQHPLLHRRHLVGYVAPEHDFRTLANTAELYYQQRYQAYDSDNALTVEAYLKTKQEQAWMPSGYWTWEHTLEQWKLGRLLDKQVIKLSNGESKRLKIAGALLRNPQLLLLDNPLAGLDVESRTRFSDLLSEITRSGCALILATSTGELPQSISNVLCLQQGRVEQCVVKGYYNNTNPTIGIIDKLDEKQLLSLLNPYPVAPFPSIVSMKGVRVGYGRRNIISKLNWEVHQGEHWVVAGPNGSGKTTLLSLLAGDHPQAYSNEIQLFGRRRGSGESIWDIKRKVGFVSPELHQYFPKDSTCLQTIESGYYDTNGLFRASKPQQAQVAMEWMSLFGLERYAHTLLQHVPAGVQRLCMLARALVKKPPLLVFDEPAEGLDEHYKQQFAQVVEWLTQVPGLTTIYVSHYREELPKAAIRVLQLPQ